MLSTSALSTASDFQRRKSQGSARRTWAPTGSQAYDGRAGDRGCAPARGSRRREFLSPFMAWREDCRLLSDRAPITAIVLGPIRPQRGYRGEP